MVEDQNIIISDVIFTKSNNLAIVVFDNFYTEKEYNDILDECLFLCKNNKMQDPEDTGSALSKEGKILKQNKAVYLDGCYNSEFIHKYSDIVALTPKISHDPIVEELVRIHEIFYYLNLVYESPSLISYYENSDYYKSHKDRAALTSVCWFYKDPKKFTGGNLIVDDNTEIECKKNRLVIFPSIVNHSVTDINMEEKYKNNQNGRFTVSTFYHV